MHEAITLYAILDLWLYMSSQISSHITKDSRSCDGSPSRSTNGRTYKYWEYSNFFRICMNKYNYPFITSSSTYLLPKQITVAVTNLGTQSATDAIIIRIEITIAAPELKWGRSGCIMHRYRSTAEKCWSLIKRIMVIYV